MPTIVTFRAGVLAATLFWALTGCSQEQQDWRAAEGADTSESWERFVQQHPDSELAPQARAHLARLAEERDWQRADKAGTIEAYRGFLAAWPHGSWAEHARIRIEGFSLGSAPRTPPPTPEEVATTGVGSRVRAFHLATAEVQASAIPAADASASAAARGLDDQAVSAGGDGAMTQVAQSAEAASAEGSQAAPAAAAPMTTADGYGVQLGAFGSQAGADREWQRLQGRFGTELHGLSPRIVVASSASGQLYRLQAPAAGEAQARALCDSLKEKDQACVPVLPR